MYVYIFDKLVRVKALELQCVVLIVRKSILDLYSEHIWEATYLARPCKVPNLQNPPLQILSRFVGSQILHGKDVKYVLNSNNMCAFI